MPKSERNYLDYTKRVRVKIDKSIFGICKQCLNEVVLFESNNLKIVNQIIVSDEQNINTFSIVKCNITVQQKNIP